MNLHKKASLMSRLTSLGLILVLLTLTLFSVWAAHLTQQLTRQTQLASRLSDQYEIAHYAVGMEESLERKYRLEPSLEVFQMHRGVAATLTNALQIVQTEGSSYDRSIVAPLLEAHKRYLLATIHMFAAVDAGDTRRVIAIDSGEVDPIFDHMADTVVTEAARHHKASIAILDRLGRSQRLVKDAMPVVFSVGLALLGGLWWVQAASKRHMNEEAQAALRHAFDQLEVRVAERTSELAQANETLQQEVQERTQAQVELRQAEAQLVQSAKLASLGTLSAGVAHELNQPLAIIRGLTQELQAESDFSEYLREDLATIEKHTSRMSKIINHMRTFCRASSPEFNPLDINEVAQNSLILIGQQLKAHEITVEWDLCADLLPIHGDSNELEQVVLNLLTNALDALNGVTEKRIVIRSRVEGNEIVLEIQDNGAGVPEQLQEHIFDPFFTTKEPGKGTGLGLSISYDILTKHQGTLSVHNDMGAVFALRLPVFHEPSVEKSIEKSVMPASSHLRAA